MKKQVLFRNFFLFFFGPLEKNNGRESVGKDKKTAADCLPPFEAREY